MNREEALKTLRSVHDQHGDVGGYLSEALRFMQTQQCYCGKLRKEYVSMQDSDIFYPRVGCLICDVWDGPVRLKQP